jgi:hypothetical protein
MRKTKNQIPALLYRTFKLQLSIERNCDFTTNYRIKKSLQSNVQNLQLTIECHPTTIQSIIERPSASPGPELEYKNGKTEILEFRISRNFYSTFETTGSAFGLA